MRVSDSQIFQSVMFYLRKSQEDYFQGNERVASGKDINRPSDDPSGAGRAIRYRGQIANMGQYGKNIQRARAFLNQVDSTLGHVTDLLVSAKSIALTGANATQAAGNLSVLAENVGAILDQIVNEANAQVDDQYLFGGYDIGASPYDSAGNYLGDSGVIQVRITESNTIALNFPGDQVFGTSGGGVDIFQVLTDLETALRNNDLAAIQAGIGDLDTAIDQVKTTRSLSGYRINHLDTASVGLESLKLETTSLLSYTEDADLAEAIMNFSKQEVVLQSVLASSARILKMNLMSFLE